MKKRSMFLFVLLLIFIILLGCNNQKSEETKQFEEVIDTIITNFECDGYEETMKDKSVVLALPMEYEKIEEAEDYLYYQKLFNYRNATKKVTILLQITKSNNQNNSWNNSLNYEVDSNDKSNNESLLNQENVQLGVYSFTYGGYNYLSVAISESDDSLLASTELVNFNNKLIDILTK